MFANPEVQRWAGRTFLMLATGLGMMGYYFANVRFLPLVMGFVILAGVCYSSRMAIAGTRPLRTSGNHPAI